VGLVIVNLQTRQSVAEQAVYRLRGVDTGEHTFQFVVAGSEAAIDGETLAVRLAENERAYVAAAKPLKERQMSRALAEKRDASSFEHALVYEAFAGVAQTHKAEQLAQQEAVAKHVTTKQLTRRCYERDTDAPTMSDIGGALEALGLEFSPILESPELRKDHATAVLRRAFGISKSKLVVMTVVEAWMRRYGDLVVYTHDGHRISEKGTAAEGEIVLGRYLCDDALSLEDEVVLVRHIKSAYAGKELEIRALAKCLVDSGFLARRTLLLGTLVSRAAEEILANVGEAIAAAVGPSPRLRDALTPADSAFGCTRSRRRGDLFV
jgi:hypothetical protein